MIEIRIDGQIHIKNLPPQHLERITQGLELTNPNYEYLRRKNPYAARMNQYVKYYRYHKKDDVLTIDRGNESRIRDYLSRSALDYECKDERVECLAELKNSIRLRNNQHGVPEQCARSDQGLIRCDTGFGKTVIALRLAELIGQRTLIIVPKIDILNQFVRDTETFYDFRPGILQGKERTIEKITIATAQSLARLGDHDRGEISRSFGCVMVDECHLFTTQKRRALFEFLPSKYRYGFTATDRRSDGQGKAINYLFGEKIVDEKVDRLSPKVKKVDYHGRFSGVDYAEIIEDQVDDPKRNQLIADLAREEMKDNRKVLILTKRVAHYEELHENLKTHGKVIALKSNNRKDFRSLLLDELRKNPDSYNCLLGTFSLLSTGVDIPSLDTLIIAGDLKSDVLVEQSVGRILRLFDGKPRPKIIDIMDRGHGILNRQANLRLKFYTQNGWTII